MITEKIAKKESMGEINILDRYAKDLERELGTEYYNEVPEGECGPKWPKPWTWFNTQITRDSIKHFVDGIGDLNPLYRNPEYARNTKYGRLMAPPAILYTIRYAGIVKTPVPSGIRNYAGGEVWEWLSPLGEGEEINFKTILPTNVRIKTGRAAGKTLIYDGRHEFTNKGGELVAVAKFWIICVEIQEAAQRDINKDKAGQYLYTEEYIKEVYKAQDNEIVRGKEPRYWEDVQVGEILPPVVRGPYTLSEAIAFLIGSSGAFLFCSDRLHRLIVEGKPNWEGLYEPNLKVYLNELVPHLLNEYARKVGVPGPHDFGRQRTSWIDMVFTNWMGDDGFLWKLRTEYRGLNLHGDTTWCKAKVIRKYCDNGKYCVDAECWAENQRGEVTMPGTATVILPSREHGPVVYPQPGEYQR